MHDHTQLLTSQFLEWVAARPRCYTDVMEAWRTSCPRLPVWEEAVEHGWVQVEHRPGVPMGSCAVVLTSIGRERLDQAIRAGRPRGLEGHSFPSREDKTFWRNDDNESCRIG